MPGETLALHNFGNIGRIIGVSAIEEFDHAGDLQTSECDRGSGGHGIGEHLLCTRDEEAWDQLAQRRE
jgi:hypothetical protein